MALALLCSSIVGGQSSEPPEETRLSPAIENSNPEPPRLWDLPPGELGTQRILRLNYQDPERGGSLKLVLRLLNAKRFSLQANDQFNRSWFRIAVEGEIALLLDLREKTFCRYRGAIELEAVPLGPLPFDALPALLLGRLPIEPRGILAGPDGTWTYQDSYERRWTARTEDGQLLGWTLWEDDEPEVYWTFDGRMSYLSSRSQQLQMRWRTGKTEALSQAPYGIEPPAGFVDACSDSALEPPGR